MKIKNFLAQNSKDLDLANMLNSNVRHVQINIKSFKSTDD